MRITRVLPVLVACTSLIVGCSKEEKKESKQDDEVGETAAKDTHAATSAADTTAAKPARPFGNKLAGLLGGSKADGEQGGVLKEIDLADVGEHLGDLGAAGATPEVEAAGQPAPPAMPVSAPSSTPAANAPATGGNAGKCGAVADRVLQIMRKEMASGMGDVPPELASELEKQIASARGQIVAECKKANWPPAVYKCLLAATDMTSLTQCESLVSGGAPAESGGADEMDGIPTEVQPSGNAQCDKVAEHVFDVMLTTASAEEREMAAAMKAAVISEVAKQCTSNSWSAAARACVLGAKTAPAMEQCATKHGLE